MGSLLEEPARREAAARERAEAIREWIGVIPGTEMDQINAVRRCVKSVRSVVARGGDSR
jgi:FAD/FMN-containing dehydrogenase